MPRMFVPSLDRVFEPMPHGQRWIAVTECDRSCDDAIHEAVEGPIRHTVSPSVVSAEGVPVPPGATYLYLCGHHVRQAGCGGCT